MGRHFQSCAFSFSQIKEEGESHGTFTLKHLEIILKKQLLVLSLKGGSRRFSYNPVISVH